MIRKKDKITKLHNVPCYIVGGQKLSSKITYKREGKKNHLKGYLCLYTVPCYEMCNDIVPKTPFCNIFFYMSCMLELHTTIIVIILVDCQYTQ